MTNRPFVTRSREETELLLEVHKMEETRIAGPGSSRRDIRNVLWTVDEVCSSIPLDDAGRANLESLISYMVENNQIMVVQKFRDGLDGHVTRTAETIRLLGHAYEYWHRGRPGADAIRWLPVAKEIPGWNHYRFDTMPAEFDPKVRHEIEKMTIRSYASILENLRNIPTKDISEYKLVNARLAGSRNLRTSCIAFNPVCP